MGDGAGDGGGGCLSPGSSAPGGGAAPFLPPRARGRALRSPGPGGLRGGRRPGLGGQVPSPLPGAPEQGPGGCCAGRGAPAGSREPAVPGPRGGVGAARVRRARRRRAPGCARRAAAGEVRGAVGAPAMRAPGCGGRRARGLRGEAAPFPGLLRPWPLARAARRVRLPGPDSASGRAGAALSRLPASPARRSEGARGGEAAREPGRPRAHAAEGAGHCCPRPTCRLWARREAEGRASRAGGRQTLRRRAPL